MIILEPIVNKVHFYPGAIEIYSDFQQIKIMIIAAELYVRKIVRHMTHLLCHMTYYSL